MNSKPRRVPEDDVSECSTESHAKLAALHPSSEGEITRLELERQLSVSLSAQTERDHRIAQLSDELAEKSALLEQAETNAAEEKRLARLELREHEDRLLAQTSLVMQKDAQLVDVQTKLRDTEDKLDELLLTFGQQFARYGAKLEAKESELKAVRLRLADPENGPTSLDELVASRDQQIERYEKELASVRAKLESKESELMAVRLRLADAEDGRAKGRVEANKLHTVTAASLVDLNEDRDMCELREDMQVMEAELASKQWNEKGLEAREWSNEG